LALGATGEELSYLRLLIAPEHQLIGSAAAAGAGLAMYISANGPDSPFLFVHTDVLLDEIAIERPFHGSILWDDRKFENTEEVGKPLTKRGNA
jgi:hypothetical protein